MSVNGPQSLQRYIDAAVQPRANVQAISDHLFLRIKLEKCAEIADEPERSAGVASGLGVARRSFSARRTPADYQARRNQLDWMARQYAMRERGERLPSQQATR